MYKIKLWLLGYLYMQTKYDLEHFANKIKKYFTKNNLDYVEGTKEELIKNLKLNGTEIWYFDNIQSDVNKGLIDKYFNNKKRLLFILNTKNNKYYIVNVK